MYTVVGTREGNEPCRHAAVKVVVAVSPAVLVTVPGTTFVGKYLYLKINNSYKSPLAQC